MNEIKIRQLESELITMGLMDEPNVENLFQKLKCNHELNLRQDIFDSLYNRLSVLVAHNKNTAIIQPDSYRPYANKKYCNDGKIHISTQPNGVKYYIDVNALLRCVLILGGQGSGKSRLLTKLLIQIKTLYPAIKICVIDFKNGFRNLHPIINAKAINLESISLTLDPPSDMSQEAFLYELTSQIAESTGIIYGVDLINTAAERALEKANELKKITKADVSICLSDLLYELYQIQTKSYRIGGYLDADKTALSFLIGKSALFRCRKGLSIKDIIKDNCIINCRSITHDTQARWLVTYILYWLYQDARNSEESKTLKRIVVVDDANRVLQKQKMGNTISSLGNILSLLRSTGTALIAASQLPSMVSHDIISLSKCMFTVGAINGEHIKVIKEFMGLTCDQANQLTQFKNRESLTYISGSSYSLPIHGFVPMVEDLQPITQTYEDYSHLIEPWKPLSEVLKDASIIKVASNNGTVKKIQKLNSSVDRLVYDCLTNPFVKASDHAKTLPSIREYDTAKTKAVQEGYLLPSQAGKALYLIPTDKSYKEFNIKNSSARAISLEHSFYVNFSATILKSKGLIAKTETPIGNKGATIDVTATNKSGEQFLIEFTISTANLLSNAIKLQDSTAFQKIIWLTKDASTAKAIQSYFNTKSDVLPKELYDKFEYIHFSNFVKGKF